MHSPKLINHYSMKGVFIQWLVALPVFVRIILLGVVYWLFAWIGTLTFYKDFGVAVYWPATGIAILGIYLLGRYTASAIFIISFLTNYQIYSPGIHDLKILIICVTAISTGNTIGALLGSRCLEQRVLKNGRSFFRLDSVLAFLLFVVLIPSLITSLSGGFAVYLTGLMPDFFQKAHSWLLADLIGVLVIVPVVISWIESPSVIINRRKLVEFCIILVLLAFSGYFIFTNFFGNYFYNFMIAYFTAPIYFWIALRFDTKAVLTIQLISLVYISYLAIFVGHNFLLTVVDRPYILLQGFSILISILILIVHSIYMERSRIILSLHKSEQDLKDVLANLPLGVGILNKSAEPEFLNSEFSFKTGLNTSDFIGIESDHTFSSSSSPSAKLLKSAWKSYIDGNIIDEDKDISLITANRDAKDFSLRINAFHDRFLMVMMDITQRNLMLERIKENERRLSSLIQNLQGMVYQRRVDRNWTMEFVSEGSFQLTGYLPSDFIYNSKLTFVSIIHERYRDYVWETIREAIKKGEPYTLQYQIYTSKGEMKWVAENGNGIFGSDGICRSLEGFIYDISDRVKTLDALKKGEEKFHSLFENMPVSLWEDDYSQVKLAIDLLPARLKENLCEALNSNRELYKKILSKIRIVDMNRTSLQLYGEYSKDKLIENSSEIFSSGDPKEFCSVLTSFYNGTSTLEERVMQVKIKRKKRYLTVRWFIMPGHERDLSRILVTILDITDLKKAEREIRFLNHRLERKVKKRTEELDRTNQELEAFSYSISHDLKAPLRAIRGFSSLLKEEYGKDLPEGALHYIYNIQKNSENMTLLITDLLQFSRLGRKSLIITTFDSGSLVNSILKDLYSLNKPEYIEFVIKPLPVIDADENLVTQVFVNLFSNAVKFSKPGTINKIEISCKTDSDWHEYCVSDQGIGFDQKHAEKIFKVFQRLHTPEEYEGSGVGLSLVQRIIHRHGGTVRALSEPEKGAKFFFTLPVEIDSE